MRFTQHASTFFCFFGLRAVAIMRHFPYRRVTENIVQAMAKGIAGLNVAKAQAQGRAARADGEAREVRSPRLLSTPQRLARSCARDLETLSSLVACCPISALSVPCVFVREILVLYLYLF